MAGMSWMREAEDRAIGKAMSNTKLWQTDDDYVEFIVLKNC